MHVRTPERTVYVPFSVGFRRFEFADAAERDAKGRPYRVLLVNGQPVKFKGVNLHEHDPRTGHYVDEELLLRDMRLMKAHNVNAIRTCHYPQQRRFYELCDSLGFYVYSEANVESHGMGYDLAAGRTLGNDRAWWPAHETRLRNMYMRCRNYPSVSIFSPANESGNGYNFYKAYEWLEAREKGEGRMNRPICYERAQWEWNTDMFVPMYPTAGMLEEWGREGTDRPVVPCEYSHAMGNSNGSLWLQWQSIYKYPNLQGGFIWDWVDQGFERRDAAGTLYWTYGGDYGDREPSDGNFCCNGLVSPDRTPHPAMAEVRYAYADIAFRPVGPARGSFEVENRFYFTSLEGYDIVYTVEADGKAVRSGTVRLQTAPQQRETVDAAVGKLKPGRNYYLRLRAVTRTDRPGLPAGTVVAEEQFPLQKGALPTYEKEGERLALSTQGDRIEAANDRVRFAVNLTTGAALSYEIDGTELFADGFGVRPNFWRAPVDNDYGDGMPRRTQVWKEASCDADAEVTGRMEGDEAVIAATRALAGRQPRDDDLHRLSVGGGQRADALRPRRGADARNAALRRAVPPARTHGRLRLFRPGARRELLGPQGRHLRRPLRNLGAAGVLPLRAAAGDGTPLRHRMDRFRRTADRGRLDHGVQRPALHGRGSRRRTGRRPRLPVAQLDEKRLQRGGQGA